MAPLKQPFKAPLFQSAHLMTQQFRNFIRYPKGNDLQNTIHNYLKQEILLQVLSFTLKVSGKMGLVF